MAARRPGRARPAAASAAGRRRTRRADGPSETLPAGVDAPLARRLLLSELRQVKMLADPLRVRVLEVLLRGAATPKQVAHELGERPSRLYHHVAALERAGLVRLVATRPVRGAVEKYYRPVARQFVVDRSLFAPERGGRRSAAAGPVEALSVDILTTAAEEIRRGLAAGTLPLEDARLVELARVPVRVTRAKAVALMRRIRKLIAETVAANDAAADEEYRLTIAFYPTTDRSTARGR